MEVASKMGRHIEKVNRVRLKCLQGFKLKNIIVFYFSVRNVLDWVQVGSIQLPFKLNYESFEPSQNQSNIQNNSVLLFSLVRLGSQFVQFDLLSCFHFNISLLNSLSLLLIMLPKTSLFSTLLCFVLLSFCLSYLFLSPFFFFSFYLYLSN